MEYVEFIDQAVIQVAWYPAGQVTLPCEPAENFLVENLGRLTNDAITSAGGINNVGENNEGNSYSRVIAVNGNFVRSPGEIGIAGLIDRGVQQAVDVFGMLPGGTSVVPFNSPVRVCLQGEGDVIFLSAADQPRVPTQLTSVIENGYSCADVPNSGTVVLVHPLESTPEITPVP